MFFGVSVGMALDTVKYSFVLVWVVPWCSVSVVVKDVHFVLHEEKWPWQLGCYNVFRVKGFEEVERALFKVSMGPFCEGRGLVL